MRTRESHLFTILHLNFRLLSNPIKFAELSDKAEIQIQLQNPESNQETSDYKVTLWISESIMKLRLPLMLTVMD